MVHSPCGQESETVSFHAGLLSLKMMTCYRVTENAKSMLVLGQGLIQQSLQGRVLVDHRGTVSIDGINRVCHLAEGKQKLCWRLWTVYVHYLRISFGQGSQPLMELPRRCGHWRYQGMKLFVEGTEFFEQNLDGCM